MSRVLCSWPGCREMVSAKFIVCLSHDRAMPAAMKVAMHRAGTDRRAATEAITAYLAKPQPVVTREAPRPFCEPIEKD